MATQSVTLPNVQTQPVVKPRPAWYVTWQRFARNKPALLGLCVITLLVLTALFAPMLAPYDYAKTNLNNVEKPPSAEHWLGTDQIGRDMLSRLIYGARSVVFVIFIVSTISLTLGLTLGAIAGYFGGWSDTLISRVIDFLFAFPDLLFIFFIAATLKPAIVNSLKSFGQTNNIQGLVDFVRSGYADYLVVMVALSILGWAGLARLVRGQILSLREKDFVLSAQAVGVPTYKIIFRYLIPNSLAPILVAISMGLGGIALAEGILAYLGIGLQPPNPSWGIILSDNVGRYWREWPEMLWLIFLPFVIMASVVFAFNFVGDGLNEALNPELQ
ncbi:MAG: ABC transporter permease [Chloroflexi bacterium]|nr:ABC transporter permease [Chloroflexota bacterium]